MRHCWVRDQQSFVQHQKWIAGKDNCSIYLFKPKKKKKKKEKEMPEMFAGDSQVLWGPWLKPMAISLNKSNQ